MTEVEFTLEVDDVLAGEAELRRQQLPPAQQETKLSPWVWLVILAALTVLFLYAAGPQHLVIDLVWSIIMASCFAFVIFVVCMVFFAKPINVWVFRHWLANGAFSKCGQQRVGLTPSGLNYTTKSKRSLYRWPGIRNVRSTDDYVFFFFPPYLLLTVPRRAFPTSEAYAAFVETAKQYNLKSAAEPNGGTLAQPGQA